MSKDLEELRGKFDRTYDYLRTGYKYVQLDDPITVLNDTTPPNASWTDLDLSANIPEGGVAAEISLYIRKNGVDSFMYTRKDSAGVVGVDIYAAAEATYILTRGGVTGIDSSRKIQYYASSGTFDYFRIKLHGYYIPILQE